jgi:Sec-independent protein translocase protein TatA
MESGLHKADEKAHEWKERIEKRVAMETAPTRVTRQDINWNREPGHRDLTIATENPPVSDPTSDVHAAAVESLMAQKRGEEVPSLTKTISNKATELKEKAGELVVEAKEKASEVKEKAGEIVGEAKEKAGDFKEKMVDVKDTILEKASDVKEVVQEKAENLKEKAGELVGEAKEKVSDVKEKIESTIPPPNPTLQTPMTTTSPGAPPSLRETHTTEPTPTFETANLIDNHEKTIVDSAVKVTVRQESPNTTVVDIKPMPRQTDAVHPTTFPEKLAEMVDIKRRSDKTD